MLRQSRADGKGAKTVSGNDAKRIVQAYRSSRYSAVAPGWKFKPGFLLTQVRSISARINQNYDAWPSEELKKSYKSFVGRPVFVNHGNEDPSRARGVVIAARYVENGKDKYIETIMEIDAKRFPKLAHEIRSGGLDSVSMGVEAGFTKCSICENRATDIFDMCSHIKFHKGETLRNKKTGKKTLVYENCFKLGFFELSYVFDPADETALVSRVIAAGKKQSNGWSHGPGKSEALMGNGHALHVFHPHQSPLIHDRGSPIAPSAGTPKFEWVHTHGGDPVSGGHADSLEQAQRGAEDAYSWDPENDAFDPREIGARRYVEYFDRREGRVMRKYHTAATEDYKGYKIKTRRVKKDGFPAHEVTINGHYHWTYPMKGNPSDPDRINKAHAEAVDQTKRHVDDSIARPDAYEWSKEATWYRHGYGEVEAPEDIDTLRDESEDDTDDFHHWVQSPPELRAPDMDKAKRLDRTQEDQGLDGDRRVEDAEEFGAPGEQQFEHEEHQDPNDLPMPINPPATRKGKRNRNRGASMSRSYRYAAEDDEDYGDDSQDDSGDDVDSLVDEAEQDLEDYENEESGGEDDDSDESDESEDEYPDEEGDTDDGGDDSGDEQDSGDEEEASGDQPPWLQKDSSRPVRRRASRRNKRGNQGREAMTGTTLAQRGRVAARGRRHQADDNGYTDGGPYGVDDSQGLQEDVFISDVPSAEAVDMPADDASNISNTPESLVARRQAWQQPNFDPNHYQRLADVVSALPPAQRRAMADKMVGMLTADNRQFNWRTFFEAARVPVIKQGNRYFYAEDLEDPDRVDPSLSGTDVQDLKGDDFENLALDDVETQPKDASIHAFRQFDHWLAQATGRTARQHGNANFIRRAAASYAKASRNPQATLQGLFPTLEYILAAARTNEDNQTRRANMRRHAEDTSLETAAPDGRVDVEAPVKNVTDEEAQASQFDLGDFANNAGDDLADPVLDVVDGNAGTWAPDKGKESSIKLATGVEAVRCADAYIKAMPNTYKEADRWKLTARFETLRQPVVRERIRLLEAVAEDRKHAKTARKVTAASSRGTKGIPVGFASGQRTAATQKVAASDPDTDSLIFFG